MLRLALLAALPAYSSTAALLQDHTLSWQAAELSAQLASYHLDVLPQPLFQAVSDATAKVLSAKNTLSATFKHGKGVTWWLPMGTDPSFWPAPRSAIEVAIHHLYHVAGFGRGDVPTPPIVGAEWWIQDRDSNQGINYHYDKDEAYASLHMTMRFPEVATVTYLSSYGGPTLVLNQTTPDGNQEVPELPQQAYLSHPQSNKHLLFRGNLQHGVPEQLTADHGGRRTTLLVNWWRERPQPPNVLEFEKKHWRELGLLLDERSSKALIQQASESRSKLSTSFPNKWQEMPLSGSTQRFSYEIAPTDMFFLEVASPSTSGNWHIEWPTHLAFGPIVRLDLQHQTSLGVLFRDPRPKLIIALSDGGQKHWQGRLPKWLPDLHRSYGHAFKFVLADPTKTADFMRRNELTSRDTPTVMILDTASKPERWHKLPKHQLGASGWRKKVILKFVTDFLESEPTEKQRSARMGHQEL